MYVNRSKIRCIDFTNLLKKDIYIEDNQFGIIDARKEYLVPYNPSLEHLQNNIYLCVCNIGWVADLQQTPKFYIDAITKKNINHIIQIELSSNRISQIYKLIYEVLIPSLKNIIFKNNFLKNFIDNDIITIFRSNYNSDIKSFLSQKYYNRICTLAYMYACFTIFGNDIFKYGTPHNPFHIKGHSWQNITLTSVSIIDLKKMRCLKSRNFIIAPDKYNNVNSYCTIPQINIKIPDMRLVRNKMKDDMYFFTCNGTNLEVFDIYVDKNNKIIIPYIDNRRNHHNIMKIRNKDTSKFLTGKNFVMYNNDDHYIVSLQAVPHKYFKLDMNFMSIGEPKMNECRIDPSFLFQHKETLCQGTPMVDFNENEYLAAGHAKFKLPEDLRTNIKDAKAFEGHDWPKTTSYNKMIQYLREHKKYKNHIVNLYCIFLYTLRKSDLANSRISHAFIPSNHHLTIGCMVMGLTFNGSQYIISYGEGTTRCRALIMSPTEIENLLIPIEEACKKTESYNIGLLKVDTD